MNSVVLMGRLTRDPELRQTPNGIFTCALSIAVDRGYTKQGEERRTDFINCVAWRQTAEFISKYFAKGEMIAVEGRLQVRTWTDEGRTRYAAEVVIDQVHFCGGRSKKADMKDENIEMMKAAGMMIADDDLPF